MSQKLISSFNNNTASRSPLSMDDGFVRVPIGVPEDVLREQYQHQDVRDSGPIGIGAGAPEDAEAAAVNAQLRSLQAQ